MDFPTTSPAASGGLPDALGMIYLDVNVLFGDALTLFTGGRTMPFGYATHPSPWLSVSRQYRVVAEVDPSHPTEVQFGIVLDTRVGPVFNPNAATFDVSIECQNLSDDGDPETIPGAIIVPSQWWLLTNHPSSPLHWDAVNAYGALRTMRVLNLTAPGGKYISGVNPFA